LSEEQRRFLALVLEHPSMTVSQLYQQFGASTWKGARLREALVTDGYLVEVETRMGKIGRAATFLLPTAKAIDAIPTALPTGRGGPLHRHVQRLIVAEATSKGYQATVEHELVNSGIVDVHVDRGADQVAVEIAITSDAGRELEHIRAALDAGYPKIVDVVMADSVRRILERELAARYAAAERERVVLVPLGEIGRLL
jgi:hypothetical protein